MKRTYTTRKHKTEINKKLKSDTTNPNLHEEGYEIINFELPSKEILDEIRVIGNGGFTIFNNTRKGGDKKRSQNFLDNYHISPKFACWKRRYIEKLLKNKYPNHKPNDMVVLKSKKGCRPQLPHCDYDQDILFARCPDSDVPLGCLISLMENTTLDIWIGSIRLECLDMSLTENITIHRQTINLQPGKMLIFRGDLVHAGSGYDQDNYRMHVYLDNNKVPRNPNRTWYVKSFIYEF